MEYILKDLFQSGYDGFLSLEPHLSDFKGFEELEIGGKAQNKASSGEQAFELGQSALQKILEKI